MLGKLFKQEFKATWRVFVPMYGLLIALSLVNKFVTTQQNARSAFQGILAVVPVVLYVCVIVAILAMTIVVLIQRFSKNLLGDEGYLSHTLPVNPSKHIVCKLVTSAFWTLASTAIVTFSVLLTAANISDWGTLWQTFQGLLATAGGMLGTDANAAFWCFLLLVFISVLSKTLMIYAGMGIGQCSAKHKVGFSILATVALNIAEQLLSFGALVLLSRLTRNTGFFQEVKETTNMSAFFIWSMASVTLFGAVYFWVTNRMLKRHLNLA